MNTKVLSRTLAAAVLIAALPLATATAVAVTPGSALGAAQAQRLTNLKTKGAAEIDRRLANLNAAQAKLQAATTLTAANKTTLQQQVQAEITGLTNLKTKLAADTDLATARADVASIVADYRVYALMLPKARLVASGDRLSVVVNKLTDLSGQLQTKIDARAAAGQDVTALRASLADLNAKKADAVKQIVGLTNLLALQPSDYNANHALLLTYRDGLRTAQTDLKAARDDAKSIIGALPAK